MHLWRASQSRIPNSFQTILFFDSFDKRVLDCIFLSNLSDLLPSMSKSRGYLHDIMPETLQGADSSAMLNEVCEKLGMSIIKCMDSFALIMMIASADPNIIAGNVSVLAFTNIQQLPSKYESKKIPYLSLIMDIFLIASSKYFCGKGKELYAQLIRDLAMVCPKYHGRDGVIKPDHTLFTSWIEVNFPLVKVSLFSTFG